MMTKYPCRLELNCFFFMQSSACLFLFRRHPASKLSECTIARKVDVVNNVSPAPSPGCAVYMEKNQSG